MIENSPYCTGKEKKQILSLIKNGKKPGNRVNRSEGKLFIEKSCSKLKEAECKTEVVLHLKGRKYTFFLSVQTSNELNEQLNHEIKRILAEKGQSLKDPIIGYETIATDFIVDYLLSLPNYQIHFGYLHLAPIPMRSVDTRIKINDFKVIKCLGSGGFSSVYLARGLFDNRYYALKMISKEFILQTDRDGIVSN